MENELYKNKSNYKIKLKAKKFNNSREGGDFFKRVIFFI